MSRPKKQATCHPDRMHFAKGLCQYCYHKPFRKRYKDEGVVHPSHTPEAKRESHLKQSGWTLELFDKVWKEQEGACTICSKPLNMSPIQNAARACADHKHVEPPVPRGILCTTCNAMLGHAQERPYILRAAALYLEKFSLESPAEATKTNCIR